MAVTAKLRAFWDSLRAAGAAQAYTNVEYWLETVPLDEVRAKIAAKKAEAQKAIGRTPTAPRS